MKIVIDCSPEQVEVIADHFLTGGELGMLPDERSWMLAQARKQHPNCKIVRADLDLEEVKWILEIESV
jgi:hypothetical protein